MSLRWLQFFSKPKDREQKEAKEREGSGRGDNSPHTFPTFDTLSAPARLASTTLQNISRTSKMMHGNPKDREQKETKERGGSGRGDNSPHTIPPFNTMFVSARLASTNPKDGEQKEAKERGGSGTDITPHVHSTLNTLLVHEQMSARLASTMLPNIARKGREIRRLR